MCTLWWLYFTPYLFWFGLEGLKGKSGAEAFCVADPQPSFDFSRSLQLPFQICQFQFCLLINGVFLFATSSTGIVMIGSVIEPVIVLRGCNSTAKYLVTTAIQ